MAGSWEIKEQNQVLCGILHVDTTTIAWSFGLRNLIIPGPILPLAGMPFDHARNVACQHALSWGQEWVFFLDSDCVPPRDAILRLLAHRLPIVSGMYRRRSPPVSVPVMLRSGQWITDFPPNQLIEVDLVGAGCLLIHRSVLERFLTKPGRPGKPWFDWRVDMQGLMPQGECLSEDFVFNLRARQEFGYKIMVDTSIKCRHIGFGEADGEGNWKPAEVIPVT